MKARAVALAALMAFSIIAGSVALAGSAAAAPSGFVTVDDSQVSSDLPTSTPMGQSAQEIADAGVMSSAHPDSLEVIVTSPGRAKNKIDGGEIHGSGPISIVLTDDQNSEGRTVALPAAEVEDALGFAPEMARGTHEDGSQWNKEIEYEDGWMLVDVPHFSTNTVSFAGQVQIGDTFTDGSTVQYDLSDLDSATDPTVNLTGINNTQARSENEPELGDGGTLPFEVMGTASTTATVTLRGNAEDQNASPWNTTPTANHPVNVHIDGDDLYIATDDAQETHEGRIYSFNVSTGEENWWYQDTATYSGLRGAHHVTTTTDYVIVTGGHEHFYIIDRENGPSSSMGGDIYDKVSHGDDTPVYAEVSGDENTVFVTGGGQKVQKYNISNKTVEWEANEPTGITKRAVTDGTNVYAASHDGNVYAYDVTDGSLQWTKDLGAAVGQLSLSDDGSTLYAGHENGITAFSISDQSTTWETTSVGAVYGGRWSGDNEAGGMLLDSSEGYLYTKAASGGTVVKVDTSDGSVAWEWNAPEDLNKIQLGDNRVFAAGQAVSMYAVDRTHGEQVWSSSTAEDEVRDVALDGNTVYFPSNDGTTYSVDKPTISTDPSASLGGSTVVSHTGELGYGETVSDTVTVDVGSDQLSIGTSSGTVVEGTIEWTDITETTDPGVGLNAEEYANHTGTLADGETVQYTLSKETLREGTNTVNVSMPELSADAPAMQVGVEYSHDAQDDQTVEYEAEKFSERYNVSKTYASDRVNPTLTIPFADTALSMRNLEYQVNDGGWQTLSDYTLDNTTLTANLPDTTAGDSVDVRGTASKVSVQDGEITVLEPTTVEDPLDSEIEITNPGDNFALDVSGIDEQSVHYLAAVDYTDPDPYALIDDAGNQEIRAPQATHGASVRVRSLPLWASPATDVEIHVRDGDVPEFTVKPGPTTGDFVGIEYRNTVTGTKYVLWDLTNDREADADTAQSPVTFTITDETVTYEIFDSSSSGSGVGPISSSDSETFPIMLILGVLVGIGGLLVLARRFDVFGGDVRSGENSVTSPLSSSSGSGIDNSTSQRLLMGGLVIIGLIALEFATPDSLYQTLLAIGTLGGTQIQELLTVFVGIGALVALWLLDQRTAESIPSWLMAVAALVTVIYLLETIQPGVFLGPASSGFETVSPLFWVVLIGGGAYFGYGYIQSRRSPDTRVSLLLNKDDK